MHLNTSRGRAHLATSVVGGAAAPPSHLCGVHLPLDNVEYGDVAVVEGLVPCSRHHHILRL